MNLRKTLSSVVALSMVLALAPAFVGSANAAFDASCPSLVSGDEIKVNREDRPAVYIIDSSAQRRYFYRNDSYKSFKPGYSGIKLVTQACFDSVPATSGKVRSLGIRPGSRILKGGNSDQLWAVVPGAVQQITDQAARALYGSDYKNNLYVYADGEDADLKACVKPGVITDAKVHPGMVFKVSSNSSKIWYMSYMNKIHEVSPSAMSVNFLDGVVSNNGKIIRSTTVYTVPDSAIAGIVVGDPIVTAMPWLTDRTYSGYNCTTGQWSATPVTPTTPTTGGSLTVSLASDNPASGQLSGWRQGHSRNRTYYHQDWYPC
jgi:hypothetical protein